MSEFLFHIEGTREKKANKNKKKISICFLLTTYQTFSNEIFIDSKTAVNVRGQNIFELLKIQYFTLQIASSPIRQEVDDDYEDIYQRLGKGWLISESKSKIWNKNNKSNQNQDFNNHKSWKKAT